MSKILWYGNLDKFWIWEKLHKNKNKNKNLEKGLLIWLRNLNNFRP